MLALSRKIGESIIIDNETEVVILDIKGDQVKIGVNAPKTIPIYRKEIYEQIQASNKEAANTKVNVKELNQLF
ncbi:MAG: carbon storage regulator CsrA [Lachnospiraceae bacterium]|nr:carbon storage regulator CsrA [Lachnospiraceae bacterium]